MIIHKEIQFISKCLTDNEIIDAFKRFAQRTAKWKYLGKQSNEYSFHVGEPACMLQLEDNEFCPAVAICKQKKKVFYIANIVPQNTGYIPVREYNSIANCFAAAFQAFIRKEQIPIMVISSRQDIGLKEIISSPKARAAFEHFLNGHPTSYHKSDIDRLDSFICLTSRLCRKDIDVSLIERYLIENKKWSKKDAEWCVNRIQTGLDILKIHRQI